MTCAVVLNMFDLHNYNPFIFQDKLNKKALNYNTHTYISWMFFFLIFFILYSEVIHVTLISKFAIQIFFVRVLHKHKNIFILNILFTQDFQKRGRKTGRRRTLKIVCERKCDTLFRIYILFLQFAVLWQIMVKDIK